MLPSPLHVSSRWLSGFAVCTLHLSMFDQSPFWLFKMGGNGNGDCCGSQEKIISAEEALQKVLSVAQRLPPVTVPLYEALGKVLAEDIRAPDPLPPYPASVKVYFHNTKSSFLFTFHLTWLIGWLYFDWFQFCFWIYSFIYIYIWISVLMLSLSLYLYI